MVALCFVLVVRECVRRGYTRELILAIIAAMVLEAAEVF
jgi:hypothetical protein